LRSNSTARLIDYVQELTDHLGGEGCSPLLISY
jgi:hypothetical protein